MNPLLEDIIARTRADLELRRTQSLPVLGPRAPVSFRAALRGRRGGRPGLIAEVKPRSPSKGHLRAREALAPVIEAYRRRAHAVSVLVDAPFFGGGLELLSEVRAALPSTPLLAKGFMVDPLQLKEVRAHGADAVLLIARILDDAALGGMLGAARELRLDPLVEVHDELDLERALAAGAGIVGVNARDLDTLDIDLERGRRLLAQLPPSVLRIAESGIEARSHVEALVGLADAALVGTAPMQAPSPDAALEALGW